MKKKYKFGEIMLILREEYKDCKHILDQLKECISLENTDDTFFFRGFLGSYSDLKELDMPKIVLIVEKRYLDILKKIQYLKYKWYNQYLYRALFDVVKGENGLYNFVYDDMLTPVDNKKYIPKIEILDQDKFSNLVDELFSSDLMKLEPGDFHVNYDSITLDFDDVFIKTKLGDGTLISWNGIDDTFEYSVTRHHCPFLLEEILSLEIPAEEISPSWLQLLQKHENDFDSDLLFDVDINVQRKKGVLQFSDIENNKIIKLKKSIIK